MAAPLTRRLGELLELLATGPAMTAATLASRWGASEGHTLTRLRILRQRGLASCTASKGGRGTSLWTTTDRIADVKAALDAKRIEDRRKAKRDYQRAYKQRVAQEGIERFERGVQRVMPAIACPPIRPPAPASVFNLAHCA